MKKTYQYFEDKIYHKNSNNWIRLSILREVNTFCVRRSQWGRKFAKNVLDTQTFYEHFRNAEASFGNMEIKLRNHGWTLLWEDQVRRIDKEIVFVVGFQDSQIVQYVDEESEVDNFDVGIDYILLDVKDGVFVVEDKFGHPVNCNPDRFELIAS